jgi:lysophospholipase L1-like esterase
MRKRSAGTAVVAALVAASVVLVGLVAVPGVSQAAKKPPPFYLSLGDSYSVGFQPNGSGGNATAGYTAYVAKKEKMQLENFGCGGATTSSILTALGCTQSGFGPVAATDAVPYSTITQDAAALQFINTPANAGKVGLVTVSIGGNDVTSCANAPTQTLIISCISAADASITANVTSLVASLHAALTAAGDTTAKVVGLTYPDVILGDWVYPPTSPNTTLAGLSVTAFDALINPALSAAYGATNFVNITQTPYKTATLGDDTPLTTTVKSKTYGVIPAAVNEICQLTYFCSLGNIHANDKGYKFIGQQIVAHLA